MGMPEFGDLLIVVAVAFAAPFVLGLFPRVRLPSVVLEIVAGIVIGPSLLGIVEVDQAIEFVAVIGLAFLLFLAGLEIEFEKLRGQALRLTALGVIIPVLKDAGEISSSFGQLVVAAGSIADFGAIILLSIFFSGESGIGSTLLLIGALAVLAAVVFGVAPGAEHSVVIR